ncbi:MAG: LysM peptidoglycan-binding domain-containing protein [Planctomycetota bacterium]|nr:LysM peptidoglycan-binding domain-containing protein [Planctomycetota bacterium]
MGSAAKFGLLILMALVIALARFLEGEVKPKRASAPSMSVAQTLVNAKRGNEKTFRVLPSEKGSQSKAQGNGQNVAVKPAPAPKPAASKEKTYTARKRDTLGRISRKVYGSSRHWKTILKANHKVLKGNEKRLKPGMTLVIPKLKKK